MKLFRVEVVTQIIYVASPKIEAVARKYPSAAKIELYWNECDVIEPEQ